MGPLHRWVRRVLAPWLDPEDERKAEQHSEAIRRNAIAARINAEQVREAYRLSGERQRR